LQEVLALVNRWIDELEALGAAYVPPDAPLPGAASIAEAVNTTVAQP
jgi:hypothetical protein